MINPFAATRRVDVERFERLHWGTWITSMLINHASRSRLVCPEDLLIIALFLWLATLDLAAAFRGRTPSAGYVRHKACAIGTWARADELPSTRRTRR
jgi:hypothetical protein